jgi:hypothetical protein
VDDPGPSGRLQAALEEFKALRDEINQRATHCHTIININIVASGTVGAFALGDPARVDLLLLIPILSPVLGLLWLDHSFSIRNIGDYIKNNLSGSVNKYAGGEGTLLHWESFLDEHEKGHKLLRFLPLGVPIGLVFAGIPLVALARVVAEIDSGWGWLLWGLGAALTAAFVALWITFLAIPWLGGRSMAGRHLRRGPS